MFPTYTHTHIVHVCNGMQVKSSQTVQNVLTRNFYSNIFSTRILIAWTAAAWTFWPICRSYCQTFWWERGGEGGREGKRERETEKETERERDRERGHEIARSSTSVPRAVLCRLSTLPQITMSPSSLPVSFSWFQIFLGRPFEWIR